MQPTNIFLTKHYFLLQKYRLVPWLLSSNKFTLRLYKAHTLHVYVCAGNSTGEYTGLHPGMPVYLQYLPYSS